ncbi:MAG TPA: DUF885 family protein, partial [Luteimonas sp.]|nr:DUF885 family protein [Luteimonas sp.]
MSRSLIAVSMLTLALAACQTPAPSTHAPPAPVAATPGLQDTAFARLSARYLDEGLALSPVSATQIGDHRFDAELDDLSAAGRQAAADWSRAMLAELDALDTARLSRENQVDALILRNQLRGSLWDLETMQGWAWDPQVYSGLAGGAIYNLMARDFAPMPQRLMAASARMEKIPRLLAQARANLDPARVPRTHAETVARQNKGLLSLVDGFITPNAASLTGADRARLDASIATLRKAVDEHQAWLDGTLVPNARGEFRIGARRYDEKLRFSLNASLTRAEIRTRAVDELARVRQDMYAVARTVLADRPGAPALPATPSEAQRQAAIEAALDLANRDKPGRDEVVDYAKYTLAEATRFVRARDLVTVPDDPVKIILMPEFQRGVAVAYCDSP